MSSGVRRGRKPPQQLKKIITFLYLLLKRKKKKRLLLIFSMFTEFSETPHQDRNIPPHYSETKAGLEIFKARVCLCVIPSVVVGHRK